MKRCSKCGEDKPREAFGPSPRYRSGLRSQCKACQAKRTAERRRALSSEERQRRDRTANLRQLYGITIADYEELWRSQDGRCASCADVLSTQPRAAAVDHCHKTGRIRGILCIHCNVALGHLREDASRIAALSRYLDRHA